MNSTRYIARKYALLTASESHSDKNATYKSTISQILSVSKSAIKTLLAVYTAKVNNPTGIVYNPVPVASPSNPVVDNINKYFVFTPVAGTNVEDYEYQIYYSTGIVNDSDNTFTFTPAIGKSISDYEFSF